MTPTLFAIANRLFQLGLSALMLGTAILCACGCSTIRETTTLTTTGTNEVRVTVVEVNALFDSKNTIGRLRASNGKTQVVGATDVSEETSTAGLQNLVSQIVKGAVQGAK